MKELSETLVTQLIQPRPAISHKGTFGRVLLIGGNQTFGGAIIMSTLAAVYSGAGLTTVATEKENHGPIHVHCPEAMVIDWKDDASVLAALQIATVILIGPGLGTEPQGLHLLELVLKNQQENQWLIIDGSGITLFAQHHLTLPYPETTVFTPHQMEWQRLAGLSLEEQTDERNLSVQQQLKATVVLKSHRTTIYTLRDCYRNPLGTPAMATGGTGDTLAGMIAGFLAQFPDKELALLGAVFLHSYIAEELAKDQYVVLPTQISQKIPFYMNLFKKYK